MPAEVAIVEAKARPIAVVAVTTVLSKWPRSSGIRWIRFMPLFKLATCARMAKMECSIARAKTAAWILSLASRLNDGSRSNSYQLIGTRWEVSTCGYLCRGCG